MNLHWTEMTVLKKIRKSLTAHILNAGSGKCRMEVDSILCVTADFWNYPHVSRIESDYTEVGLHSTAQHTRRHEWRNPGQTTMGEIAARNQRTA